MITQCPKCKLVRGDSDYRDYFCRECGARLQTITDLAVRTAQPFGFLDPKLKDVLGWGFIMPERTYAHGGAPRLFIGPLSQITYLRETQSLIEETVFAPDWLKHYQNLSEPTVVLFTTVHD